MQKGAGGISRLSDLFASLERERATLLAAIQDLPADTLNAHTMVGDWSIKNVLAHLTNQERLVSQVLPARLASGTSPEIVALTNADGDARNARQIAACEHLTPHEQLLELQQARLALLQALLDDGEEALERRQPGWDGGVAEYIMQVVREHEREHQAAVLVALTTYN